MMDKPFPILGETIPPLVGRAGIMQRLWNDLTKATPNHLSMVGPRHSGKSVLLNELAKRMRQPDSPYGTVILWDLGHHTPDSDDAFLMALCKELGKGLESDGNEYGEHLLAVDKDAYGELREVIETLNDEKYKILMLWDGFDKPLSNGKLTRNLWDQLRELASNPSLRLVTATRRPLHELIRSEESVTSDFWNIFDMTPVRVGVFDENDRNAALERLSGLSLNRGAKSELENWSAGYPPFYLAILNRIVERGAHNIDPQAVNTAAKAAMDDVESILHYLWNDCPETAKNLYLHLAEHGEISASDAGKTDSEYLKEKGFVKISGNNVVRGCRLLEAYVKNLGGDSGSMMRLFGPWESYRTNIRGMLELRLDHLTSPDPTLRRFIQKSIEDIPDYPDVCLTNIRGIVDRALDLIWDVELGKNREIPGDWFTDWKYKGEKGAEGHWNDKFPINRGHQIRLLHLMTGTEKSPPKANRVSKNTWALANAAHGFGNFGQHIDRAGIHVGVAVSAVNVCIELAASLDKELGGQI